MSNITINFLNSLIKKHALEEESVVIELSVEDLKSYLAMENLTLEEFLKSYKPTPKPKIE